MRQRAVANQILTLISLAAMSIVGLPVAFKLKSLGWSKEATIIVSLLVAAPISVLVLFVLPRWLKSAAAKKSGGPLSPT